MICLSRQSTCNYLCLSSKVICNYYYYSFSQTHCNYVSLFLVKYFLVKPGLIVYLSFSQIHLKLCVCLSRKVTHKSVSSLLGILRSVPTFLALLLPCLRQKDKHELRAAVEETIVFPRLQVRGEALLAASGKAAFRHT